RSVPGPPVRSVVCVRRDWTAAVCGSQRAPASERGLRTMTTATLPPADAPAAALLDVRAVAQLLACSPRHVYRLADAAKMPSPVRLGSLVRWRREALEQWIKDGCHPLGRRGGGDQ